MDSRPKTQDAGRNTQDAVRNGSAIILAVVLTSLLAIVGVIFLLSSRVDSVATSAISENKDLNLAVDTVVAQISEGLAVDVFRGSIDPNQYADYPDPCNPWLACLEPFYKADTNDYRWRRVSDLYGGIDANNSPAVIVGEHQPVVVTGELADADGDGVSDSRWVIIPVKTSSKGKPIYAAVHIVDSEGMLNVNTGYKFDPSTSVGASQSDINLMALSALDSTHTAFEKENRLLSYRCGSESNDVGLYEQRVIWQYGLPVGAYTPFDISDELVLRNRYIINRSLISPAMSRIETLWTDAFDGPPYVPRNAVDHNIPYDWFWIAYNSYPNPCPDANVYDNRHLATTYNFDRVINPAGQRMFNVNSASYIHKNDPNGNVVRLLIRDALLDGRPLSDWPAADGFSAQIAANLIDCVDGPGYPPSDLRYDPNNDITVIYDSSNIPHFGFEQPCIYISELAQNFYQPDANDANLIERSYAIELYKPYADDLPPGPCDVNWQLVILDTNSGSSATIPFTWTGSPNFQVFSNDVYGVIKTTLADFEANNPHPLHGAAGVDPNIILEWPVVSTAISYDIYFGTDFQEVFNATPADANVYKGNVPASTTTYDPPGSLTMDTVYYWRIDTHTAADVITGRVWRFTVNTRIQNNPLVVFNSYSSIYLQRRVYDPCIGSYIYVTVDSIDVPTTDINTPAWLRVEVNNPSGPNVRFATHSFQRDTFPHKPIRRLWDFTFGYIDMPSIGLLNAFDGGPAQVQAHPANQPFTNVGEFGRLFYHPTYAYGGDPCLYRITEPEIRVNLALPAYQQVFRYLTVMDPNEPRYGGHPTDETRIKGRININTAPWFVIAQLPWVSYNTPNYELAQAIVAYRDKLRLIDKVVDYSGGRGLGMIDPCGTVAAVVREEPGFASIGELMNVTNNLANPSSYDPQYDIRKYATDGGDLGGFPDLTTPDHPLGGAVDDFEERDVIFDRISNLVTVRSDVFTAYILVRVGQDGPQKRVVAILDRSGVPEEPVKVIAIQPVPDAR